MSSANWCQLVPSTNQHQAQSQVEKVPTGAAPFRGAPIGTNRWRHVARLFPPVPGFGNRSQQGEKQ